MMSRSTIAGAARTLIRLRRDCHRLPSTSMGSTRILFSSKATSKDARPIAVTKATPVKINLDDDLYKPGDMRPDREDGKSEVEIFTQKMSDVDPHMVYTSSLVVDPPPPMPDNPQEMSSLDPAYDTWEELQFYEESPTGHRVVHIRQIPMNPHQAPNNSEQTWTISFDDEGSQAEKWTNPLMGWKSGADAMCSVTMNMNFDSALEAVEFAKTRKWSYIVERPIFRKMRDDDATYQDNFLPQSTAGAVMRDGIKVRKLLEMLCVHYCAEYLEFVMVFLVY